MAGTESNPQFFSETEPGYGTQRLVHHKKSDQIKPKSYNYGYQKQTKGYFPCHKYKSLCSLRTLNVPIPFANPSYSLDRKVNKNQFKKEVLVKNDEPFTQAQQSLLGPIPRSLPQTQWAGLQPITIEAQSSNFKTSPN